MDLNNMYSEFYLVSHLLDNAPVLAKTIFAGFDSSVEQIESRFNKVQEAYVENQVKLAIRYAQDYTLIQYLFQNSQDNLAIDLIEKYSSYLGDSVAHPINQILQKMGTTYTEECVKAKELISPAKLDDILAQKGVIGVSSGLISSIYQKDMLVGVSKNRNTKGYYGIFISTNNDLPKVLKDCNPKLPSEASIILLNTAIFLLGSSNLDKFEKRLDEQTKQLGMTYSLLNLRNISMFGPWYSFRFEIEKVGAEAYRNLKNLIITI